jgi:hypothetical protein
VPAKDFSEALDLFYSKMLPDVPPGPAWLHDVAMVGYDFLSDGGRGWERDAQALAEWLKPEERKRVAMCLHGAYDALGVYCFDAKAGKMKNEWLAFGRTRKVKMTQEEIRRRLDAARKLGFRVLLYFGDGVNMDSGVPEYRPDWIYKDEKGRPIPGWQGPDTFDKTYAMDPANPEVAAWFKAYLKALLEAFGPNLDGVVWDETFHIRIGMTSPHGYCDRAMMALVRDLTHEMHAYDKNKVFLASDCAGVSGWQDVPGYAMMSDGMYQDTHCEPVAWSYALFPCYRNTLWSCNWKPLTNFEWTRWGRETFGTPVAYTNGWDDDRGPSEWTEAEREKFLKLFRLDKPRVRFLLEDPAGLVKKAPKGS